MNHKAGKIVRRSICAVVIVVTLVLVYFTVQEYRPAPVEEQKVPQNKERISPEKEFTLMTYNIGYGGLSKETDFFMDGGKEVQPASKGAVERNLKGISSVLKSQEADAYFIQEADLNSKRSYHIDQKKFLEQKLKKPGVFAYNFNCKMVPYPFPVIGHVESGLLTMTDKKINHSVRISLPESFSWPVKTCNLKRCLMKTSLPLEGTDKQLVLINFHLEAYDEGEGKIRQSRMLEKILKEEYEKGNYVVAGGDFNQKFDTADKYPVLKKEDIWKPGEITQDSIPEGFQFAVDDSYPTCRVLNAPYTGSYDTSQVYVLDGFIVSPNVEVKEVRVINTDFEYTDHQPVRLVFKFK